MQKNLGKIKRTVEEYVVLTVATLILVVGVYVFKFPNNFSFGGVTGLAVVLGAVLPTSPGNLTFIINMLLLVLGFIFLGRGFGVKTVYVSVLTSVGLSFAERVFPMDAPLTGQPVLELIYAIVLPAFSAAILFNIGAVRRRNGYRGNDLKEIYEAEHWSSIIFSGSWNRRCILSCI